MVIGSNILAGAAGQGGAYEIEQSIRFNSADSAFLSRTPSSGSAATQYAISVWCKRGLLDEQYIFMQGTDANNLDILQFQPDSTIRFYQYPGSSTSDFITTQVFRDTGAWYHIVVIVDTTQGTAGDRVKIYVNGSRVTDFSTQTNPGSSATSMIGGTSQMTIGRKTPGTTHYHDGYMAEFNMVFGTPSISDFGETNSDTGQWVPKKYTGSYGTNGFYITGADSADLGADDSGNGNDFTSSGLAAADQVTDSPTDNFCTLNAVDKATQVTLADGNLQYGLSSNSYTAVRGTFGVSSGKWYWEMNAVSGMGANTAYMGIATNASSLQLSNAPTDGTAYTYISYTGNKAYTSSTAYGDTWNTNGRVIGVALDLDAGKIWWSRDGVFQASGDPAAGTNEAFSGITGTWHPYIVFNDTSPNFLFNFGQSSFTYTPPTGFNALSTANLPDPTIADPSAYFQTTLYTGDGTAIGSGGKAVDQSGNSTFQPDFVWIKNRSAADNHMLYDAVRGATKDLHSNTTDAEATDTEGLSTFDADGFTVGSNVEVNTNTENYVAWQWKANGSGGSNTDGTVTSTISANTTSGFSVAKWTHTTASDYTVGHGLGAVPKMILVKTTDQGTNWGVYHSDITVGNRLLLNSTSAQIAGYWGANSWTSSTFSIGSARDANGSTMIAYCFAEIESYSAIGSYIGNGSSDGPFIYTGFKPAFVLLKNISAASQSWEVFDNKRDGFNDANRRLYPNASDAEPAASDRVRLTSNGFKIVTSGGTHVNGSGNTIIYYAVAETPFKTATAR